MLNFQIGSNNYQGKNYQVDMIIMGNLNELLNNKMGDQSNQFNLFQFQYFKSNEWTSLSNSNFNLTKIKFISHFFSTLNDYLFINISRNLCIHMNQAWPCLRMKIGRKNASAINIILNVIMASSISPTNPNSLSGIKSIGRSKQTMARIITLKKCKLLKNNIQNLGSPIQRSALLKTYGNY